MCITSLMCFCVCVCLCVHKFSRRDLTHLQVSRCGEYVAVGQEKRVTLFRYYFRNWDATRKDKLREWIKVGSYESHVKRITHVYFTETVSGLDRIEDRIYPRLFSVGEDRIVQEYDVANSSLPNGLKLAVLCSCCVK